MAGPRIDPDALRTPAAALQDDEAAWDRFVAAVPTGAYTQLTAWARVKAPNGWRATRVVADGPQGPVGAQVLVHRLGPTPWAMGYAPRGPVAAAFGPEVVAAFTSAARAFAVRERLTHLTIDPELPADGALAGWLRAAGWVPGARVQDARSRLVDLTVGEATLWSGLRSKWRQYVQKARRSGVTVSDAGVAGLETFFALYVDTARRAGFVHRAASAYRDVFEAYAAHDAARLLVAQLPDGEPAATLMLLSCGGRVIEPYGGMSTAGAEARANYLLKWEAIRSSAERGFAVYDMWGLATPGIEQFKAGFGGREVAYVGAWELRTRPLLRHLVLGAAAARERAGAWRQGVEPGGGGDAT
jgi:lipid II:glycine glycyltransferase (peptidoglycan interpeptide bridge formation enzyme)